MSLHLQIRRGPAGRWWMTGLPCHKMVEFEDLSQGLEFAKRECASVPATIEVFTEGMYICQVSQEEGWPRQLCRPAKSESGNAATGRVKLAAIGEWLQRSRLSAWCFRWVRHQARQPHADAGALGSSTRTGRAWRT